MSEHPASTFCDVPTVEVDNADPTPASTETQEETTATTASAPPADSMILKCVIKGDREVSLAIPLNTPLEEKEALMSKWWSLATDMNTPASDPSQSSTDGLLRQAVGGDVAGS